jgi:hypothetical protein
VIGLVSKRQVRLEMRDDYLYQCCCSYCVCVLVLVSSCLLVWSWEFIIILRNKDPTQKQKHIVPNRRGGTLSLFTHALTALGLGRHVMKSKAGEETEKLESQMSFLFATQKRSITMTSTATSEQNYSAAASEMLPENDTPTERNADTFDDAPRAVHFGTVAIYDYSLRLCDNPGCQRGPAIGIHKVTGRRDMSVEDYEQHTKIKGGRRILNQMRLSRTDREFYLKSIGYSTDEIDQATQAKDCMRNSIGQSSRSHKTKISDSWKIGTKHHHSISFKKTLVSAFSARSATGVMGNNTVGSANIRESTAMDRKGYSCSGQRSNSYIPQFANTKSESPISGERLLLKKQERVRKKWKGLFSWKHQTPKKGVTANRRSSYSHDVTLESLFGKQMQLERSRCKLNRSLSSPTVMPFQDEWGIDIT